MSRLTDMMAYNKYPPCGWILDDSGLPPMPREEKLMKDELEKIIKNAVERRNETMTNSTDYTKPCNLDFLYKQNTPDETPAVTGVDFGKEAVYLRVRGDKCQIYPKDETAKREVEVVRNLDIQEFVKTYHEKTGKTIPGGKVNRLQKALMKWRHMLTPFSTKQFKGPAFNRILFSGRATILFGDKDKTVVKCMDGESYDPEKALLIALFIREYGKNTYQDLMDICHEEYKKCGEPGVPHDSSPFASLTSMTRSAKEALQAFAESTKKTD